MKKLLLVISLIFIITGCNNKQNRELYINSEKIDIDKEEYEFIKKDLEKQKYKNDCAGKKEMYNIKIDNKEYSYYVDTLELSYKNKCASSSIDSLNNIEFLYSDKIMNKIDNVKMEIKDSTLTNTEVTIIITDTNKEHYTYGSGYRLDIKKDGKWQKYDKYLPLENDFKLGHDLMAYSVDKNNRIEFKHNWEKLFGPLEKGEYRLVKDTCSNDNFLDRKYFAVEFII